MNSLRDGFLSESALRLVPNTATDAVKPSSNSGSSALSMKTALLRPRMTENSLENEGRRASWWSWITENAGEPQFRADFERSGEPVLGESQVPAWRVREFTLFGAM